MNKHSNSGVNRIAILREAGKCWRAMALLPNIVRSCLQPGTQNDNNWATVSGSYSQTLKREGQHIASIAITNIASFTILSVRTQTIHTHTHTSTSTYTHTHTQTNIHLHSRMCYVYTICCRPRRKSCGARVLHTNKTSHCTHVGREKWQKASLQQL